MKIYLLLLIFILNMSNLYLGNIQNIEARLSPIQVADTITPYALIAGGSKGIGYAIAEALAKRKYNLILVARNEDTLSAVKNKLETLYPIHVEILSKDLSKESSATEIATWCNSRNIHLKILCNVAGIGGEKDFLTSPLDSLQYMIRLNVESMMSLTLMLLPLLEKNAPANILNVSSMAAFAPIPAKNLYSSTKSAILYFSYGLRYQLKMKGITVSCLCPGPVFTKPSIEKDTKDKLGWFGQQMAVSPQKVGEITVKKMLKGRMIIVPGTVSKLVSIFLRAMPKRCAAALYNKLG
jgi:uncharacterized protein